jgi:hypothetical protein
MTTPTLPSSPAPEEFDWQFLSNTQSAVSPLTKATKTYELQGAAFGATISWQSWLRADIATLVAFLIALRGSAGRFLLWNLAAPKIRGIGTGTPVAVNSGSTKTSLKTSGWTASKSGILLPGDYIGCNGELKIVTDSVDSDSSGDATITVEPPFRTIPSDDDAITTDKPTATFMLVDDQQVQIKYVGSVASLTIQAVEDVTA